MRVFNTYYENKGSLKEYIKQYKISNCENILIQVFTGIVDKTYIEQLILNLIEFLPHAKIIGATTDGEILETEVSRFQTVLSFSLFENTSLMTYHSDGDKSDRVAKNMIERFKNPKEIKLFITFTDGSTINGEEYIKTFEEFDKNLIIAGGLAGDNGEFKETFIFTEEGCFNKGGVGVALYNPDLMVNTEYNFGWENIGKYLTVTAAKDNVVYKIDDMPAHDIYTKYLGEDISSKLPATGIEFPMIIKRDGVNIARAILAVNDEDGSLTFAGNVHKGDTVQFGYGNVDAILTGKQNRFQNLNNKPIEAFFVYSCMARRRLIGKAISVELDPLHNIAPVSGFFTYGELYHNKKEKKNELLNQTMTIVSISENRDKIKEIIQLKEKKDIDETHTIQALSHLIAITSCELQELNHTLKEEVKAQVEIIKEKQNQLIQQSRHAVMGEMIGMIAHQWRQPLAAISASVGSLSISLTMDNYEKTKFQDHIHRIGGQSQFLSETIDDFRNFFRENREKMKVTLEMMIDNTLDIISASIENSEIELKKSFKSNINIQTYPNELKQVILNLIKNAKDALLEKSIDKPVIWIKTYNDKENVYLEVEDNAGGINLEIMEKIFEPYFTTKTKKDGTGLGLYMSKVIIEEHCDGEISVQNSKNGAIFKIKLGINDG